MADLHPELARLLDRYQQLVADASAGAVSGQDAYALLGQLSVTDASGAVWGIDDEGAFVRRRNPNEAPERVPPGLFATSVIPQQQSPVMPAAQPAQPMSQPMGQPMAQPAMMRRPVMPVAQGVPQDGQPGVMMPGSNMPDPRAVSPQREQRMDTSGQPGLSQNSGADFVRHRSDTRPSLVDTTKARLEGRGATIAVFSVILVALVLGAATRGDMPQVSAAATTVVGSQTTIAAGAANAVPVVSVTPTDADITRVFAALTAGDASVLIDGGATDPTGTQTSAWTAYGTAGASIRGEPAAANGAVQLQLLTIYNTDGAAVATYRATWVQQAGIWALVGWPERLS
jgi:hypothetical protein